MEYTKSQRGRDKLCFEGYVYSLHSQSKSGLRVWRCERRDCVARVHIQTEELVKRCKSHIHAPDPVRKEVLKIIEKAIDFAKSPKFSTEAVWSLAVTDISDAAAAKMPSKQALKRIVQRYRQHEGIKVENGEIHDETSPAKSLIEITIPGEVALTKLQVPFVLWDTGAADESHRIIVFGTKSNLQLLAYSSHWFADSTFKATPPLFSHLYTFHCVYNSSTVPCIYALLPNKLEETYVRLLQILLELEPSLNPQSVMTDFDNSAINAMTTAFPGIIVTICFYHVTQDIWKKIQQEDLVPKFGCDVAFSVSVKMIPALAFVPASQVEHAFESLTESLIESLNQTTKFQFQREAVDIVNYFEDKYIGRCDKRGRRKPPFPIQIWNLYDRVNSCLPYTNSVAKEWHLSFLANEKMRNPSFMKFMDVLKEEQSVYESVFKQFESGSPPPTKKSTYRTHFKRFSQIVSNFDQYNIIDYLREIAHIIEF